jgi:hypothetical protein
LGEVEVVQDLQVVKLEQVLQEVLVVVVMVVLIIVIQHLVPRIQEVVAVVVAPQEIQILMVEQVLELYIIQIQANSEQVAQ